MADVLRALHRILLRQLHEWLFYGSIVDPYGEFIVADAASAVPTGCGKPRRGCNDRRCRVCARSRAWLMLSPRPQRRS